MRTDVKVGVVISLFIVLIAGWYYMDGDRKEEPISLQSGATTDAGDAVQSKTAPAKKPVTKSAGKKQHRVADAKRPAGTSKRTPAKSKRTPTGTVAKNPQHTARDDQKRHASASDKVKYQRPRPSAGQTKTPRMAAKPDGSTQKMAKRSDGSSGQSKTVQNRHRDGRQSNPTLAKGKVGSDGDANKGAFKTKTQKSDKLASTQKQRGHSRPESSVNGAPIKIGRQVKATPTTDAKATPSVKASLPTSDAAAVDMHRVQKGDTIAALSQMYYGDEKYTQFLIEQNPAIANPRQLRVGTTIRIPAMLSTDGASRDARTSVVTAADKSKRSGNQESYTVRSGDTFYGIARKTLGNAGRWQEIYELNKSHVGGDPSRLKVGQVLVLPSS